jgi:uncharacterized iron-regulated membrane protein
MRKILFWCHLGIGVTAGLVILIMSLTGVLLAYQAQILRYVDRNIRVVQAPRDGSSRLTPAVLFNMVAEARPTIKLLGLALQSDPREAAAFQIEGPTGPGNSPTLYVNPYTGKVQGQGSLWARGFFRLVTDWHRWLGVAGEGRPFAKQITGICNAGFLLLALSGIYLWWPRRLTIQNLRAIAIFRWPSDGRARDWNWHNVTGFWCSLVLVVLTATAVVISYPWASDLIYRLMRSEVPARPSTAPNGGSSAAMDQNRSMRDAATIPEHLDALWAAAEQRVPQWRSITFRVPQHPSVPVVFAISDGEPWDIAARSQLTFDPATAQLIASETYADETLGRRVRTWMRFLHTGEALGPFGQTVAGLASAGGVLLVCTGASLAFRRLLGWLRRRTVQLGSALEGVKADHA